MFAEITLSDPNHYASIGWMVVSLAGVMAIIYLGICIWQALSPKPTGAEVLHTAQNNFATKDDLDKLSVAIEVNRKETKSDVNDVYMRVDDVRKEMDTKITALGESIGAKIDRLPDKVIVTLKNTGAI